MKKLFKNKKGEGIKDIFYATIIISILTIAGVGIVSVFFTNNPTMQDNEALQKFNSTFNKQTELIDNTNELSNTINQTSLESVPLVGPTFGLIQTTWAYLKGMGSSFSFITSIFTEMPEAIGVEIPPIFGQLIVVAIIFTIGFVIIGLIFKWWV